MEEAVDLLKEVMQNECVKRRLQPRRKLMLQMATPYETTKEGRIYAVYLASIRHSFFPKNDPLKSPYVVTPNEECNTPPTKILG